jgi:alkylation response protein AidB-like acyl-CoA dehydrogenase
MTDTNRAALEQFRLALRTWLDDNLTPELVAAGDHGPDDDTLELLREWNHKLFQSGWAAVSWPAEYGGRDAGVDEQIAYHEEMARAGAPGPVNVIGVSNIAPAIMALGTAAQRDRFLGPMLRGDEIWSQGMSEPDAGSDLASLRTSATLDGDTFVVNGQKTWNSLGRFADWCQLYVRTEPGAPKHKGISCLLVDMRSPGIEVRPLRTMAGDLSFSELFFTDVRVPREALLGELHQGWRVAMTTLSHERAGVSRLHLGLTNKFEALLEDARGTAALTDPVLRNRLAAVYSLIACMRFSTARELEAVGHGSQPSATFGSLSKLMWAHAEQELAELALAVLGPGSMSTSWAHVLASSRQASIAGGTTEINRNIVAEQGLGLPREPALR